MRMHNPPHPGILIRATLIEGAQLSVTEAASKLGVTRVTFSRLINGKSNISPEMALRLSMLLNTSAEMWLNAQQRYDLYKIQAKRKKLHIEPLVVRSAFI